jgi:hypothetical protein
MKKCTKCKIEKNLEDFYTDKRLSDGRTSACKVCVYESQVKYRDKSYFMTTHHNKASQCRVHGIPYDLTAEYLKSIWTGYCPVFGMALTPREDRKSDSCPHLDRTDPTKGYVKGNVVFLSRKANLIKSNASAEDIYKVYKYMKLLDTH